MIIIVKIITLQNGNKIEVCESTKNSRSKRSELISFWCFKCNTMYVDVPISEYIPISSNIVICKKCLNNIRKDNNI